jgi:transcriptional regulator with XRE-family HTH domain
VEHWGLKVKQLREARSLRQEDLAQVAGLTRGYIAKIEMGIVKSPTIDTFEGLAQGFHMTLDELREELTGRVTTQATQPEDLLTRYVSAQPHRLVVQTDFVAHAGEPVQPPEYYWIPRGGAAPKGIEAINVHGNCLEPTIMPGDVIIVDKNASVDVGQIVACVYRDELHLGRLRKVADDLYLENGHGRIKFEECAVAARVIQIERKLR